MIEDRGTNGTQPLIGRPIESQSGTRWSRVVRWNPTVTWKYNNNNNNNNKTEHDSAPSRRERICGAILWFAVYSLGNLSTRFRKSTSNPIERDRPLLLPRRTSQSTCRKRRAQPIKRDRSRMNRMDRIQIFDIGIFNLFDPRRQALRKWNSFRWKRVEPIEWMKRNGLGRRNFFFIIIIFLKFVGRQDVGLGALRSCRSRLPHQVELEELVEWVELVQKSRQNKRKKQPPPSMPHFINFFSFFFLPERAVLAFECRAGLEIIDTWCIELVSDYYLRANTVTTSSDGWVHFMVDVFQHWNQTFVHLQVIDVFHGRYLNQWQRDNYGTRWSVFISFLHFVRWYKIAVFPSKP